MKWGVETSIALATSHAYGTAHLGHPLYRSRITSSPSPASMPATVCKYEYRQRCAAASTERLRCYRFLSDFRATTNIPSPASTNTYFEYNHRSMNDTTTILVPGKQLENLVGFYNQMDSGEQLNSLITEIKDWQITHGSLLKLVGYEEPHTVPARPIGVSVFPTPFPRHCFDQACQSAPIFNRLYAAIAEDDVWLETVLHDLIGSDELVGALWEIHTTVKTEGFAQDLNLGIFRSDYMLHAGATEELSDASLKQVEFNAFSVAGGTHGNIVSDMHQHLQRRGAYELPSVNIQASSMPRNETVSNLVSALALGHNSYVPIVSSCRTCILVIVQPQNINICDERPIEYALWAKDPAIPTYRLCFGPEFLFRTSLGADRELLFEPRPGAEPLEVSVVYMRAGYDTSEYHTAGREARLRIERSRAIKCPSVTAHLATLKKVQQGLTEPGVLNRFLSPEDAAVVESVFVDIFPLDDSAQGLRARELAEDEDKAVGYVLKPSLEGGGHNVYRDAIPGYLASISRERWGKFVLMEMIIPPEIENTIVSWQGRYDGSVVSELGIFGTILWRKATSGGTEKATEIWSADRLNVLSNAQAGWSFKTKSRDVDEMSVVKGYGCFDSPLLVTDEKV